MEDGARAGSGRGALNNPVCGVGSWPQARDLDSPFDLVMVAR
jgi:hypothetical protein